MPLMRVIQLSLLVFVFGFPSERGACKHVGCKPSVFDLKEGPSHPTSDKRMVNVMCQCVKCI